MAADRNNILMILGAGAAIILLGVCALAMPTLGAMSGGTATGWLLVFAGLLELIAFAAYRGRGRWVEAAAGTITLLAGSLFLANPVLHIVSASWIITIWLLLRGLLLLGVAIARRGPLTPLARFAGPCDLLLALALLIGLPLSALPLVLFGATPEIMGSFAIVLAASFLVTGASLIAIARTWQGRWNA
jgi:uncharacterized membrane protein HdeD (DUF308 family)